MPAQKALPVPVRMTTRVCVFSISSRAACNSAIIGMEIALRFSGRLRVMVESCPVVSNRKVSKFMSVSSLVCCAASVLGAKLIGQFDDPCQFIPVQIGMHPDSDEGAQHALRGNIADKFVSCERASAKSGESRIEPAATGLVRCQNFGFGVLGAGGEVDAQPHAGGVASTLRIDT